MLVRACVIRYHSVCMARSTLGFVDGSDTRKTYQRRRCTHAQFYLKVDKKATGVCFCLLRVHVHSTYSTRVSIYGVSLSKHIYCGTWYRHINESCLQSDYPVRGVEAEQIYLATSSKVCFFMLTNGQGQNIPSRSYRNTAVSITQQLPTLLIARINNPARTPRVHSGWSRSSPTVRHPPLALIVVRYSCIIVAACLGLAATATSPYISSTYDSHAPTKNVASCIIPGTTYRTMA